MEYMIKEGFGDDQQSPIIPDEVKVHGEIMRFQANDHSSPERKSLYSSSDISFPFLLFH